MSLSVLAELATWMLLAYRVVWPHLDHLILLGAGELPGKKTQILPAVGS